MIKVTKDYAMKELTGQLPKPLPQSYVGTRNFILKHSKECGVRLLHEDNKEWKRYRVDGRKLKAFVDKYLGK